VALACNTSPALPAGTCTVSPTSITPTTTSNYTATVTVATTKKSFAPSGFSNRRPPLTWLVVLLAAALVAFGGWARRAGARRLSVRLATMAGIALLVFASVRLRSFQWASHLYAARELQRRHHRDRWYPQSCHPLSLDRELSYCRQAYETRSRRQLSGGPALRALNAP
jgi:hypothetical protein